MALLLSVFVSLLLISVSAASPPIPQFSEAPAFRNPPSCRHSPTIHIAMTLDATYLRGSLAGILSLLQHSSCPQNLSFHFLAISPRKLRPILLSTFPSLSFRIYRFDPTLVRDKISSSVRRALDQPLNYARIYLADLLPPHITKLIYFDSDLIVLDDVIHLWNTPLSSHTVLAAPEYCHANFTYYFTNAFWSNPDYVKVFESRTKKPCYFNTGVMVMDLMKWRAGGYTKKLEYWMEVQKKKDRIYELGSLPPFLLVFAGEVKAVEHKWNQHGLGGDNVDGLCRDLHPGSVSLLHWSGKGKPWLRLDAGKACPLDYLWKPYDLLRKKNGLLMDEG